MKGVNLVSVVAILLMASVASAATVWNPAGNSVTPGSQAWGDVNNWTNGLPDADQKAVFNVPGAAEAQVSGTFSGMQIVQGDNNVGGVLRILSGGSLTTKVAWSAVGYNNTAHVIVDAGGTYNFAQHAWIGLLAGANGTLDISGTVTVGQMLGIGWNGGVGTINVQDGGVLDLFQMHGDGSSSVKVASVLNIDTGGQVLLPGDYTSIINAYIANGRMASDGVIGPVAIDVSSGDTVLTAIPEPATMILLGLGGLLIRKRR